MPRLMRQEQEETPKEPAGNMLRSEPMVMVQMIVQADAASETATD